MAVLTPNASKSPGTPLLSAHLPSTNVFSQHALYLGKEQQQLNFWFQLSEFIIHVESILIRVSIAVQRHHNHSSSYKGKHLLGWLTFSEVHSIVIMMRQSGMQAGMVLEKDLRFLTSWHAGNRKWSVSLRVA